MRTNHVTYLGASGTADKEVPIKELENRFGLRGETRTVVWTDTNLRHPPYDTNY